jgi:hypothetical protein
VLELVGIQVDSLPIAILLVNLHHFLIMKKSHLGTLFKLMVSINLIHLQLLELDMLLSLDSLLYPFIIDLLDFVIHFYLSSMLHFGIELFSVFLVISYY